MSLRARLRARLRRSRVGIWYHSDYAAPGLAATSRVDHLEPDRGEKIIARLLQEGLLRPVDVRTPPLVSVGQLRRFHGLDYLERGATREALGRIFGLEPHNVDPESLLGAAKRGVGGTICALHEAAARRLDVAINLGGGFHHAEPEQGAGFCVFNDVGVAVADLRSAGWHGRVAIVDLDFHQGNGNTVAFANDPSVLTYSVHGSVWSHIETDGQEILLTGPVNDRRYLATLHTSLETSLRRFSPSLVVYIAGTDVLAGDRLGSFWLTLRGAFERDRYVARVVRSLGVPLVVTLGGGYSPLAWRSSFLLVRALLTGAWRFDGRSPPSLRARYARIAAGLTARELQGEPIDNLRLTEEDIMGALGGARRTRRFLDFYSAHGMEVAFERYGILDKIRARGFRDLEMELDPSDPTRQVLRVRGRYPPSDEQHLLVELVIRRSYLPSMLEDLDRLEVLSIEWLLLQDPTRDFSLSRPRLPGQKHPGLGIAREFQELFVQACHRLGLMGLQNRPSYYHNALGLALEWRFVDPEIEGRFRAMRAVLADRDVYEATTIVDERRLVTSEGEPFEWIAADHLLPVEPRVRAYFFESETYLGAVRAAKARFLGAGLRVQDPDISSRVG